MKVMKYLQTFITYLSITIIFISLCILIGWSTNTEFFQMFSQNATYASIISACIVLYLNMLNRIYRLDKFLEIGTTRKSLSGSISLLTSKKRIKNLYIYAVTTGKIYPLIAASNITIDNCILILPNFNTSDYNSKEFLNNDRCNKHIEQWKDLVSRKMIKNLSVYRTSHWPDIYMCIVDKSELVYGFYTYNNTQVLTGIVADIHDTIYLKSTNESSRHLFEFYYDFFIETMKYSTELIYE